MLPQAICDYQIDHDQIEKWLQMIWWSKPPMFFAITINLILCILMPENHDVAWYIMILRLSGSSLWLRIPQDPKLKVLNDQHDNLTRMMHGQVLGPMDDLLNAKGLRSQTFEEHQDDPFLSLFYYVITGFHQNIHHFWRSLVGYGSKSFANLGLWKPQVSMILIKTLFSSDIPVNFCCNHAFGWLSPIYPPWTNIAMANHHF